MDVLEIARQVGMQVLLDARVGRETYHSVCGSLPSLQRFADAVRAAHAIDTARGAADASRDVPPAGM
jgi:hypothetical protein